MEQVWWFTETVWRGRGRLVSGSPVLLDGASPLVLSGTLDQLLNNSALHALMQLEEDFVLTIKKWRGCGVRVLLILT